MQFYVELAGFCLSAFPLFYEIPQNNTCRWWRRGGWLSVPALYGTEEGDEERDGEIRHEAVEDAEDGEALAGGAGDDGQGGVHRGGAAGCWTEFAT